MGQTVSTEDSDTTALSVRIEQLERETAALRAQLGQVPHEAGSGQLASYQVPPTPSMDETEGEYVYVEDLLEEMRALVWTKGDYRIVPYGSLWGSASYDTARTSPGAYTLFVPSSDVEGEDAFVIDTRRTRLGLDVTGPQIGYFGCANSRGRVEIDFHGAFVVENKPGVLLRHAYAEVYDDSYRLLAGQYWDLISPLYPHTVSYSVGWGGGNIGYRRMQIRYERYLNLSDVLRITPAISVNQNIVSDFSSAAGIQPEATDWPILEGRLGCTLGPRADGCDPITFGVSGHVGEQGFDFTAASPPVADDLRVRTWSLNADVRVPITDRLGVQGEFFTGANLSTFLGGIIQGVDPVRREAIHSTGGWFEVWYDWTDRLHSHAGYSLDDPRNANVTNGRIYNHFYFINAIFDVTKQMKLGAEVTAWRTHWTANSPGDAVRMEFSGQYNF